MELLIDSVKFNMLMMGTFTMISCIIIVFIANRNALIKKYEEKILDLRQGNIKNDEEYSRIMQKIAKLRTLYLWERYKDYRAPLIESPMKVLVMLERYIIELQTSFNQARHFHSAEFTNRLSLEREIAEWKKSFDLYYNAIKVLNERWKDEHPDFEGMPDTSTVAKWASEIIDGSKLTLNNPKLMYEYILGSNMFTEEQLLHLLGNKYQQRAIEALTPEENRELEDLLQSQNNPNVIMFGYQQNRLKELQAKKYKHINPDPQSDADIDTHNHARIIYERFIERWNSTASSKPVSEDQEIIRQIEVGLMEYGTMLKVKEELTNKAGQELCLSKFYNSARDVHYWTAFEDPEDAKADKQDREMNGDHCTISRILIKVNIQETDNHG